MPKVQFKEGSYKVDEADGEVKVIVYRSGDISLESTVRCYTRQGSAQVMMDYSERPNTDASLITFKPGRTFFSFLFFILCTPTLKRDGYDQNYVKMFLQVRPKSHVLSV